MADITMPLQGLNERKSPATGDTIDDVILGQLGLVSVFHAMIVGLLTLFGLVFAFVEIRR